MGWPSSYWPGRSTGRADHQAPGRPRRLRHHQRPHLAVDGDLLVTGGRPVGKLTAVTYAELAAAARIVAGAPKGLYSEGSGVTADDPVHVDPQAAMVIARALSDGDAALRRLAPGLTPVLWPEHFDIGVTLDEVNYGVSPGDRHIPEPYAYVGPSQPRTGQFWNVSFGAARPLTQLPHTEAVYEFFDEGRRHAQAASMGVYEKARRPRTG